MNHGRLIYTSAEGTHANSGRLIGISPVIAPAIKHVAGYTDRVQRVAFETQTYDGGFINCSFPHSGYAAPTREGVKRLLVKKN